MGVLLGSFFGVLRGASVVRSAMWTSGVLSFYAASSIGRTACWCGPRPLTPAGFKQVYDPVLAGCHEQGRTLSAAAAGASAGALLALLLRKLGLVAAFSPFQRGATGGPFRPRLCTLAWW